MRKVYHLFILVVVVIFSVIGGIYLYSFIIPKTIYLQSVYTTSPPNIDGNFNSTEWASAFNISFTLQGVDEARPGELYLLNNATHLFLAFRILDEDYDGPPYPQGDSDELQIWLDPNNNEKLESYEDLKIIETSNTPYIDAYHTTPPMMYIYPDSNHGGTTDGYTTWNHTNPTGTGILTFEIVFPFLSSDPNDLNTSRGTTIGINFQYCSPITSSSNFLSAWPGDSFGAIPNEWAKLVIA